MNKKSTLFTILLAVSIAIMSTLNVPTQAIDLFSGDTTVVRTFRFDTTMRSGMFAFPTDSNKTYEKIIMLYSMRCKNGLISTQSLPNQGCGEWDYNCYTYVVDSSQTDSLKSSQNSYLISNLLQMYFNFIR